MLILHWYTLKTWILLLMIVESSKALLIMWVWFYFYNLYWNQTSYAGHSAYVKYDTIWPIYRLSFCWLSYCQLLFCPLCSSPHKAITVRYFHLWFRHNEMSIHMSSEQERPLLHVQKVHCRADISDNSYVMVTW